MPMLFMHAKIAPPHSHPNDELLYNRNCYRYLINLNIGSHLRGDFFPEELNVIMNIAGQREELFDESFRYGDYYTAFFRVIENNPEQYYEQAAQSPDRETLVEELDDFFISIFLNPNRNLEKTYEEFAGILEDLKPSTKSTQRVLAQSISGRGKIRINQSAITPAMADSFSEQIKLFIGDEFKPQHTTSFASRRSYSYNHEDLESEIRMGTIAQRSGSKLQIAPLAKIFLEAQKRQAERNQRNLDELPITHVYFNLLPRDGNDVPGIPERKCTRLIERLEDSADNVAVITLPARHGLMSFKHINTTKQRLSYNQVKAEFLEIALEVPGTQRTVKDFHISPRIRQLLFGDDPHRGMEKLIDQSFAGFGIQPGATLSKSMRQAIWFHFINYEIPELVRQKLQPVTYNFTCQTGIDRGGSASAYFNLIRSFHSPHPLSKQDFLCALHAGPLVVRARGMNQHINKIWNAVNAYVNQHYAELKADPQKAWLIEWRDFNCPPQRINKLFKQRVRENIRELETQAPSERIQVALRILKLLQLRIEAQGNDRIAMCHELAVRVPQLIADPENQKNQQRCLQIAHGLSAKYPRLAALMNLVKNLVRLCWPSAPSFKQSLASYHAIKNREIERLIRQQQSQPKADTNEQIVQSEPESTKPQP